MYLLTYLLTAEKVFKVSGQRSVSVTLHSCGGGVDFDDEIKFKDYKCVNLVPCYRLKSTAILFG